MKSVFRLDLVGQKFNRLEVMKKGHRDGRGRIFWLCRCDCGTEIEVRGENLQTGKTKSCGCYSVEQTVLRTTTHGLARHPLYMTWKGICARCSEPSDVGWENYGGRGIENRFQSLADFIAWNDSLPLEKAYRRGLQIDRKENDGHYEPNNCHWVAPKRNARNRRDTRRVVYEGECLSLSDVFDRAVAAGKIPENLNYDAFSQRVRRGASVERAMRGG